MLLPRAILWVVVTLLSLVFIAAGTALSPWGTSKLLEHAQSRGLLTYEQVEGSLLDDFVINGLHMDLPALELNVAHLELHWASDCLLKGRLCLDRLQTHNVNVVLRNPGQAPSPEPEENTSGMKRVSTPIPIELRAMLLDDINVRLADGTRLALGHFHTSAILEGSDLQLGETRLENSTVVLPAGPGLDQPDLLGAELDVRAARRVAHGGIITSDAIKVAQDVVQPAPLALFTAASTGDFSVDALDAAEAVVNPAPPTVLEQMAELGQRKQANPLVDIIGQTDAQGRVVMPEIILPLDIEAEDVAINDLRLIGDTPITLHQLALGARTEGSTVQLDHLTLDSSVARLAMQGQATLNEEYPLQLSLTADVLRDPVIGESAQLDITGALSDLNVTLVAEGPVKASLNAHADMLAPDLPFRLHLASPQVQWPLNANTGIESWKANNIDVSAEGSLAAYQLSLASRVDGPQIKPLSISLEGDGDLAHFNWAPLSVTTQDGGQFVLQGSAVWSPALDVTSSLSLDNLRLENFTQAITGRLDGNARAAFHQQGDAWSVELPELAITGTLQQRALALKGQLNGNSDMQWHIEQLDLRQGDNRLSASGNIGERLALQADLSAPALGTILPELGGSITGHVNLDGTLQSPNTDIDLRGQSVRYQDNRVGALRLQARTQGLDDPRLNASLDVTDISAAGQQVRQVTAALTGTMGQHQLTLDVNGGEGLPVDRMNMALNGSYDQARQRYAGTLAPLEISAPQAGDIALDDPLGFVARLDQAQVTAEPFCLVRQQGGRLCSVDTLQASADKGAAALRLSDIDLALANAYLPPAWRLAGDLAGDINAQWSRGGASWNVDTNIRSDADVSGQNALGQPFSLPHLGISISAGATPSRAQAQIGLTLEEAGRINLDTDIGDPLGSRTLSGRLRVDGIELSPYTPLVAALDRLAGQLNGDVSLSGTMVEPRLNGNMVLDGVVASGAQLPVALDDARMAMNFQGDHGDLDGYLQVDDARWTLNGSASWPTTGNWQANMALNGGSSPLELRMPEFGRLRVAPDIRVAANPHQLNINGDVRIPWSRLEVGQIPASAVKPSSDEVILTREEYEARQQQAVETEAENEIERRLEWANTSDMEKAGMEINVGVNLIIGDDVQLEAYGLSASVEGRLNVRQNAGALQLFGDVSLVDGRFQAFGQDLIIRRGQVLFSGPPGQPYLAIEAIRNPDNTADDVIAGLKVSGPADQPELEVFSEPAMNESRALSYLLRGKAPDASGDSDGMLTSALIGLSLSRSGKAIGALGESFGIEDLSLDTAGSGDESQVVVSGYLFDNFQVSYGMGLFSSIAELTLRYRLIQDLYLQAVSGANQAVDLIYTFSLGRTPDRTH